MANKRRYHPLVANDLSSATAYYDGITSELGNRFRASVRNRLRSVTERPESFACIHDQMRGAMLDRFPYVFIFEFHAVALLLYLGSFTQLPINKVGLVLKVAQHSLASRAAFHLRAFRPRTSLASVAFYSD